MVGPIKTASLPRPLTCYFGQVLWDESVRASPFFSSAQPVVIGHQLPKVVLFLSAKAFPGDLSNIFRNRLPEVLLGDVNSLGKGIFEMRKARSRNSVAWGEARYPSRDGNDVGRFDHVPTARRIRFESGGKEFFPLGIQHRVKGPGCWWYLAGQHFERVHAKDLRTDGVSPGFRHGHSDPQAGK